MTWTVQGLEFWMLSSIQVFVRHRINNANYVMVASRTDNVQLILRALSSSMSYPRIACSLINIQWESSGLCTNGSAQPCFLHFIDLCPCILQLNLHCFTFVHFVPIIFVWGTLIKQWYCVCWMALALSPPEHNITIIPELSRSSSAESGHFQKIAFVILFAC